MDKQNLIELISKYIEVFSEEYKKENGLYQLNKNDIEKIADLCNQDIEETISNNILSYAINKMEQSANLPQIKYETILILKNDITEEVKGNILAKIQKEISNSEGQILKLEDLGIKKLAYNYNGHEKGIYISMLYYANAQAKLEIDRICRLEDNILRFMTVKAE